MTSLKPHVAVKYRFLKLGVLARLMAMLQLLPALAAAEENVLVGGQAVMEGVMMRTPHAWGITVLRPSSGEMISHSEVLLRPADKRKWLALPVVRGVATLGQAMTLGFRALKFSANVALEEIPHEGNAEKFEVTGWMAALNVIFSLGFFILFYKLIPLIATTQLRKFVPLLNNFVLFNLVDGIIRIALFVFFIWAISRSKDIGRVFEFHGAEHKTVFAFEANHDPGKPVTVEAAQKFSTFHPRCGTSFLMTVMIISIFIYSLFPVVTFWGRFALRLVMLPVIAGVSYEIIRFAAKHGRSLFAIMTRPGLWMQRITTRQPDNVQVECAIHALDRALDLEKHHGGDLVIA